MTIIGLVFFTGTQQQAQAQQKRDKEITDTDGRKSEKSGKKVIRRSISTAGEDIRSMVLEINPEAAELDETSRMQLVYFLKIAGHIATINRLDFFKPYNPDAKQEISQLLTRAALNETDECFKKYLEALAANVPSDLFHTIDPPWIDLENNRTGILMSFNPLHAYKEFLVTRVFGVKPETFKKIKPDATEAENQPPILDAYVYVNQWEESMKYIEYTRRFALMQSNLPIKKKDVVSFETYSPTFKIAHLVYTGGKAVSNLLYPSRDFFYNEENDGFKIVMFKNLTDSYTRCVLEPIATEIIAPTPNRHGSDIDPDAYLSHLIMYKMSRHIGPVFEIKLKDLPLKKKSDNNVEDNEESEDEDVESPERLEQSKDRELGLIADSMGVKFAAAEELKNRAVALHNISLLLSEGLIAPEEEIHYYNTCVVSLVDRLRRGAKDPNFAANITLFNYFLKNGAILFDINTRKLSVHPGQFPKAAKSLVETIMEKFKSATTLLNLFGRSSSVTDEIMGRLSHLPLQVETQFQIKSESR